MNVHEALSASTPPAPIKKPIKVMIVDDALVIRGLISRFLVAEGDIEIVASVGDGERALQALDRHSVDVVLLDIEMPRMDGLTALPKIIEKIPGIQVLMISTLTLRNAEISLKALSLGAADYVPKPVSNAEIGGKEDFQRETIEKIRALGKVAQRRRASPVRTGAVMPVGVGETAKRGLYTGTLDLRTPKPMRTDIIAIGSSTGGPQALFKVLPSIGDGVQQPILVTQHMPPTFTSIFAKHVAEASGRPTKEAEEGEEILPGHIYIAAGDYHMLVKSEGLKKILHIDHGPKENFCRPAVDPMLRSIVDAYGGNVLTVILTGMGVDGKKGCEQVVAAGGQVIAQDQDTSVVWGMPGAVAKAGLCSFILPVAEVGRKISVYAAGEPL